MGGESLYTARICTNDSVWLSKMLPPMKKMRHIPTNTPIENLRVNTVRCPGVYCRENWCHRTFVQLVAPTSVPGEEVRDTCDATAARLRIKTAITEDRG